MTSKPRKVLDKSQEAIRVAVSDARMKPYLNAANQDLAKAIRIYEINIKLSEVLYPSLQTFEITFRNRINEVLIDKYGRNWCDGLVLKLENYDVETITKAKNKIKKKPITQGRVMAELNLGFWIGLLTKKYYSQSIFNKCIKDIFPNVSPSERAFQKIAPRFKEEILNLRNRVFHHEPIWDKNYKLEQKYSYMCWVLSWISPEVAIWMKSYDTFQNVYKAVSQELSELI